MGTLLGAALALSGSAKEAQGLRMARLLLAAGADPGLPGNNGQAPLEEMAECGLASGEKGVQQGWWRSDACTRSWGPSASALRPAALRTASTSGRRRRHGSCRGLQQGLRRAGAAQGEPLALVPAPLAGARCASTPATATSHWSAACCLLTSPPAMAALPAPGARFLLAEAGRGLEQLGWSRAVRAAMRSLPQARA